MQIPRRMCAYGWIEGSVKDLRVHAKPLLFFLPLAQ